MGRLGDPFDRLGADTRLAVAFSGGGDSAALLDIVAASLPRERFRALHVRHDLCDQADDWAAHCADVCRARGIDYKILPVAVEAHHADGPEAAARHARYAALATQLAPDEWLVTAQHAQDQAETFLLQALRGSGVAGLAAMPEWAPLSAGWLWRPWRAVERGAIGAYVEERGLGWIDDPMNADPAFSRSRLRQSIWPALVRAFPAAERTLGRSAEWAAEAADAVATLAGYDLDSIRVDAHGLSLAGLRQLTTARRAAVLRRWLADLRLDTPARHHINEFERLLAARAHAGPCVAFAATELRVFADAAYAMPRLAPAPTGLLDWTPHQPLELPGAVGELRSLGAAVPAQPLTITFRHGGERLLQSNGRTKRLAAWFYERSWPPWLRDRVPLIYAEHELIAVADAWHHPQIQHWLGERDGFEWCHNIVGDPRRIAERLPSG